MWGILGFELETELKIYGDWNKDFGDNRGNCQVGQNGKFENKNEWNQSSTKIIWVDWFVLHGEINLREEDGIELGDWRDP